MPNEGLICWKCGRPTGIVGSVGRSESCPECTADLRCCRGCRHFDPSRRAQCKEPVDHAVPNKEKSNFCDWFQVRDAIKGSGGMSKTRTAKEDRKSRFDDLFKD